MGRPKKKAALTPAKVQARTAVYKVELFPPPDPFDDTFPWRLAVLGNGTLHFEVDGEMRELEPEMAEELARTILVARARTRGVPG